MATLLRGSALITGAGSGIGQYAAYAFARYGIKQLAITDIKQENLQTTVDGLKKQAPNVDVEAIAMDCASEADVKRTIQQVVNKFGKLNIAVNNAGIGGPPLRTTEYELKDWQRVIDVNLTGVWLCQREELKQMLKQEIKSEREGRGVIVNTASMYGLVASSPAIPAVAYTSAKHGVMGLTRTDAAFYAKDKVRINAICPGYIETPLLKMAKAGPMDGEMAKTPMGRMGSVEEIADCITFLASPMSSYMTGAGLVADGGYTAL